MKVEPIVVRLWDYGWLSHDCVELPAAPSDAALIQQYVSSVAFHTSFLPSDRDETGIHGPFRVECIASADFIPMMEEGIEHHLESVELSETPEVDRTELAKVLPHLQRAFHGESRCFVLRIDERHKEHFHDWGFVLLVFREFLFASQERDRLERYIIGYD